MHLNDLLWRVREKTCGMQKKKCDERREKRAVTTRGHRGLQNDKMLAQQTDNDGNTTQSPFLQVVYVIHKFQSSSEIRNKLTGTDFVAQAYTQYHPACTPTMGKTFLP